MINVTGRLREIDGFYHTVITYPDANGKKRQKSRKTGLPVKGNKKKAQEILDERLEEFRKDFWSPLDEKSKTIKFTEFMKNWIEVVSLTVEVTTYASYKRAVDHYICPYFDKKYPGLLLKELTPRMIQEFYIYEMNEAGCSANTVVHYHANLHRALKYAVKTDLLDSNPVDKVDKPRIEKFESEVLTKQELNKLLEAVKGSKLELAVMLAAFYGLRREEICGLKWKNIDFENKTLTICSVVTQVNIDGKFVLIQKDHPKTKSSNRTFPLMPQFEEIFLKMKKKQEYYREICGNSYNDEYSEYVYVNELGDIMKPGYITQNFGKLLEENGIKHVRFHDLRHSCATLLHKSGVGMKDIQMWLGHSTISTTSNIYTHFDEDSKIDSANAMAKNLQF